MAHNPTTSSSSSSSSIFRSLWKPQKSSGPDYDKLKALAEHKFDAPQHELDGEKLLDHITPRDKDKTRQLKATVATQIAALKEGVTGQETDYERAEIKAKIGALRFYEVQLDTSQYETNVDADFTKDFYAWLKGCGKEEDHAKTPWYRQKVIDRECKAFLSSFVDAKYDWLRKLSAIQVKAFVTNLQGLPEHYIFFKYFVRGFHTSEDEFLKD